MTAALAMDCFMAPDGLSNNHLLFSWALLRKEKKIQHLYLLDVQLPSTVTGLLQYCFLLVVNADTITTKESVGSLKGFTS